MLPRENVREETWREFKSTGKCRIESDSGKRFSQTYLYAFIIYNRKVSRKFFSAEPELTNIHVHIIGVRSVQ